MPEANSVAIALISWTLTLESTGISHPVTSALSATTCRFFAMDVAFPTVATTSTPITVRLLLFSLRALRLFCCVTSVLKSE